MSGPTATYSLRFEKQFTGENVNTWGIHLNTLIDLIDTAVAGYLSIAITGDTILTSTNYVTDQSRQAILEFTSSTLAVPAVITIPAVSKVYVVRNSTNKAISFTCGGGATVSVDVTDIALIYCDATNVRTPGYGGLSIKDYISAVAFASSGTLPAQLGNAGKFVKSDGTNASWQFPATTDLSDYTTNVIGLQVALAVAL